LLINDLLQYSRISSQDKDFTRVQLQKTLNWALLNLKVFLEESGAVVSHDPLPAVLGNEIQLSSLFQNLISNAIKFRSDKPLRIHILVKEDEKNWQVGVQDNGIGIESQFFDQIFQIFHRLHKRSDYPGTGIGLALCKKIVERHNGRIWVESEPQVGSTFWFTLPKIV
jgi:light-regulated signal transduction histidine kinase (bacteriophytochrome)